MKEIWKIISAFCVEKWKDESIRPKLLVAMGVLGLLLILLSEAGGKGQNELPVTYSQTAENETYIQTMELKLTHLV